MVNVRFIGLGFFIFNLFIVVLVSHLSVLRISIFIFIFAIHGGYEPLWLKNKSLDFCKKMKDLSVWRYGMWIWWCCLKEDRTRLQPTTVKLFNRGGQIACESYFNGEGFFHWILKNYYFCITVKSQPLDCKCNIWTAPINFGMVASVFNYPPNSLFTIFMTFSSLKLVKFQNKFQSCILKSKRSLFQRKT